MSFDINQVVLVGRLTRDPETRFSANTAICKFSIANNTGKEDKNVSYFDIVTFGKTAERCQQYLKKGTQIAISGRLSQNRWEQEGQKRSKVEVIAQIVQFLGGKSGTMGEDSSFEPSYYSQNQNTQNNNNNNSGSYEDALEDDDDIPF
jgi:single-strand DNA-binding protein